MGTMIPSSAAATAPRRGFVAGVGDNCGGRRHFSGKCNEVLVFAPRRLPERASARNGTDLTALEHGHSSCNSRVCVQDFFVPILSLKLPPILRKGNRGAFLSDPKEPANLAQPLLILRRDRPASRHDLPDDVEGFASRLSIGRKQ